MLSPRSRRSRVALSVGSCSKSAELSETRVFRVASARPAWDSNNRYDRFEYIYHGWKEIRDGRRWLSVSLRETSRKKREKERKEREKGKTTRKSLGYVVASHRESSRYNRADHFQQPRRIQRENTRWNMFGGSFNRFGETSVSWNASDIAELEMFLFKESVGQWF